MGMTMTQKILAAHAGKASVAAGELIEAKLDLVLGNDVTTPVAITEFENAGFTKVFDKDKIAIVLDHFTPCKDINAAKLSMQARTFARKHNITNFFDVGTMGIEHALLPEKGQVSAASAQTPTPAPTAHWARFPQASAPQICAPAWPRDGLGSRCRRPFSFI